MDVATSLIGPEVSRILGNAACEETKENYYRAILHSADNDFVLEHLISVDVMSDYLSNLTDHITTSFTFQLGDFVKDIVPYRNNLEITLINVVNGFEYPVSYRFVITNADVGVLSSRYKRAEREVLNQQEAYNVEGQCLPLEIEALRLKTHSGIYNKVTVKDVILSSLKKEMSNITINGESLSLDIDIAVVDNERVYNTISIPSGTKILDLPSFIQETSYGVYNGYLGTYIQRYRTDVESDGEWVYKNILYIYPLYNTAIGNSDKRKLVIYNVPSNKYDMVENTYIDEIDRINIISTDRDSIHNTSDTEYINGNAGFKTNDPNIAMDRNIEIKEGAGVIKGNTASTDVVNKKVVGGVNLTVHMPATDNLYHLRSMVLKSSGMLMTLQWNFPLPTTLYPCMPVDYIYEEEDEIKEVHGVLHSVFTHYNVGRKMAASILYLFLDRPEGDGDGVTE